MSLLAVVVVLLCGQTIMVHGTCNKKLENDLFDDLLNMMLKIKAKGSGGRDHGTPKKDIPAFGASATEYKTLAPNEIVKFDKVWTNIGNGYDKSTGKFTAPIDGVYQFSCTAMTNHNKTLRLYLMKNGHKTVSLYPGTSGQNMGTLSMVFKLKKGETIYIQHPNRSSENNFYTEKTDNFCMFSGYLISH